MEQHQFLLDMIQVCIEHKILQLTAALRQAKWAETLSAASFSGALPSDWFGRQLVQVTPELFDEAILKTKCTDTLLLLPWRCCHCGATQRRSCTATLA